LKKLKVSKIVALAGIAAVLFGFASCDTNADDSSNLAAAVLLGQESGGTTDTPEQQDSYELTADGIKCNGVLLEKTAEKSVISTSTTITGAKYTDRNNGVFIEGRNVTLSPFIMGKYEVTQELYKAVMKGQKVTVGGTKYTLAAEPSYCSDGSTKYVIAEGEIQKYRPVENVTWYDAVYFCNVLSEKLNLTKAYTIQITAVNSETNGHITEATVTLAAGANGYRLPTEAEWEFAARGGDQTVAAWNYMFSGADRAEGTTDYALLNAGLDTVGWYMYNLLTGTTSDTPVSLGMAGVGTHEVGKKNPNTLDLYDMSGNVREWCYDWHISTISTGDETDPVGGSSGLSRVIRGGSWSHSGAMASVSTRFEYPPIIRDNDRGFRVCRSAN